MKYHYFPRWNRDLSCTTIDWLIDWRFQGRNLRLLPWALMEWALIELRFLLPAATAACAGFINPSEPLLVLPNNPPALRAPTVIDPNTIDCRRFNFCITISSFSFYKNKRSRARSVEWEVRVLKWECWCEKCWSESVEVRSVEVRSVEVTVLTWEMLKRMFWSESVEVRVLKWVCWSEKFWSEKCWSEKCWWEKCWSEIVDVRSVEARVLKWEVLKWECWSESVEVNVLKWACSVVFKSDVFNSVFCNIFTNTDIV